MNAHPFAFGVVGNLIAVNLAQTEVSRLRMGEVKATHARSGPHRKRLRDLNARVRANVQQMPERPLLGVIRARRITWSRPYAAIFFLNEIVVAQFFRAAVTPFFARISVQALIESISEAITESLRHDGVVIVVLGFV